MVLTWSTSSSCKSGDGSLWDFPEKKLGGNVWRRPSSVGDHVTWKFNTLRKLYQRVIFFVLFTFGVIMIFFRNYSETPQYSNYVSNVLMNEKVDKSFPSLERNFLLKEDVTYDDVKELKRALEDESSREPLKKVSVNPELFRDNEKLMENIAKTFSEIASHEYIYQNLTEKQLSSVQRNIKQDPIKNQTGSVKKPKKNSWKTPHVNPLSTPIVRPKISLTKKMKNVQNF